MSGGRHDVFIAGLKDEGRCACGATAVLLVGRRKLCLRHATRLIADSATMLGIMLGKRS